MANNVPSPLIRIEYGKYNPVFSEKGKLETLILASIISRIRSPSSVAAIDIFNQHLLNLNIYCDMADILI